jgi:lipopolysaccharide transport protein LptA
VKKIQFIAWLMLFCASTLLAQTNATVAPKLRAPTRIDSDRADFDLTARRAIYRGHVRVDDPQMKLSCEQLTADLPQSGGHINNMVALTNVIMDSLDDKGQTNRATSDKAVYDYKVVNGVTNETVTLTGNAKVESAQGWMTGEPIVWDRANNSMHAVNQRMQFRQSITSAMAGTNAPAAKTNLPPLDVRQTNSPATTKFSPGALQNTNRINLPKSGGSTQ